MEYETVKLHIMDSVARVRMNRPERRNAFNSQMIDELIDTFKTLYDHNCRSIVLEGEGLSFSAGADLTWMREMVDASREENLEDAQQLAELLHLIYTYPKPTIAKVHGAAMGGGVGLVAACDVAVAVRGSSFAFSEVRLGLVPAVISPYVIRKIGESAARRYMLSGEKFDTQTAQQIGLTHHTAVQGDIEGVIRGFTTSFSLCGPQAIKACKGLISRVSAAEISDVRDYTAELIADLRVSKEGQEGMRGFLESQDPSWQRNM